MCSWNPTQFAQWLGFQWDLNQGIWPLSIFVIFTTVHVSLLVDKLSPRALVGQSFASMDYTQETYKSGLGVAHYKKAPTCCVYGHIRNRRAYQNLSFFIFFIYIITGILACLRRIILSTAIGFYYLARLDKCIIIPGLEQFDKSYMSYVAFLRIQVSHSNPIVTTFCELLLRQMKTLDTNSSAQLPTLSIEDGFENQRKESLARKRWFKAVTLLRNPTLIADSKRKLMKTASALDEDNVGHSNIGNSEANVI
ncbi:hypothetical protein FSP39_010817 [Pinctada imbricata]|uniref:Receptor for retinol uptake STRA6 n=1 Tax=Pinctada imbricata TaxID=66713 RepID=A0AA88XIE2_PINIB|nr:hypothetical protein FSP39_010817 [Pinctada imbricata]